MISVFDALDQAGAWVDVAMAALLLAIGVADRWMLG